MTTARRVLAGPAVVAMLALAACGGSSPARPMDGGVPQDADFAACAEYDAGPYMTGAVVTSRAGTLTATVISVATGLPPVPVPAVGLSTFTVSIVDSSGSRPAGLSVTAEKPYMPKHMHGSSTFPMVADGGDGTFVISGIEFFQTGYWEMTLDLSIPTSGDAGVAMDDKVVIPICIPD